MKRLYLLSIQWYALVRKCVGNQPTVGLQCCPIWSEVCVAWTGWTAHRLDGNAAKSHSLSNCRFTYLRLRSFCSTGFAVVSLMLTPMDFDANFAVHVCTRLHGPREGEDGYDFVAIL